MRFNSVEQWLQWQMKLHGTSIDLGLERVRHVGECLGIGKIADRVITIAGTNGKGSSVAAYEAFLGWAGFEVASYTSPHLLNYNERIRFNREAVTDQELCTAFEAVEMARGDTSLTYFEYGTLAALHLIQQRQPDFAILEVGLGGRLDAVNIVDADLVHLTPVAIDHQAWLGETREQIGFEKAGVLRERIPVVLNDPDPPASVLAEIDRLGCNCMRLGRDYCMTPLSSERFEWRAGGLRLNLDNVLTGSHQQLNLAGVVAGLSLLLPIARYDDELLRDCFHGIRNAGRFERVSSRLACRLYADVGHNPDAAHAIAACLGDLRRPQDRVVVLLGMLEDKQPEMVVEALKPAVDNWWLTSLDCDRGLSAQRLKARIGERIEVEQLFDNVAEAMDHALSSLTNRDIMLVTGSFVTVEQLLHVVSDSGEPY